MGSSVDLLQGLIETDPEAKQEKTLVVAVLMMILKMLTKMKMMEKRVLVLMVKKEVRKNKRGACRESKCLGLKM